MQEATSLVIQLLHGLLGKFAEVTRLLIRYCDGRRRKLRLELAKAIQQPGTGTHGNGVENALVSQVLHHDLGQGSESRPSHRYSSNG